MSKQKKQVQSNNVVDSIYMEILILKEETSEQYLNIVNTTGEWKTDILLPDSINPIVFLFIDFHLCKSAREEQTNSPELSVLSEAQITYHSLHCAELIMSWGGLVMVVQNIQP